MGEQQVLLFHLQICYGFGIYCYQGRVIYRYPHNIVFLNLHCFQNCHASVLDVCGFWATVQNHTHQFIWASTTAGFPLGHSSPCAHRVSTGLTRDGGDAGGQVLLEGVLVRLRLLGLRQDVVPRVGKVGDLDLLCLRRLQLLQALRVPPLLRLHPRPDPLPPPEDQRYSVAYGLGHDLEIVLVEKSRVNLERRHMLSKVPCTWLGTTRAHTQCSNLFQMRKHHFETIWIYIDSFLTRTGAQELDGVGFFFSKTSIPNALKNPRM